MIIALVINIIINIILVIKYFISKNSVMTILAYIEIHKLPKPTDAELKILCAEAWQHMFTHD